MGDWDGNLHRDPLPPPKRRSTEVTYDRLLDEYNRVRTRLTEEERTAWERTLQSLYEVDSRREPDDQEG